MAIEHGRREHMASFDDLMGITPLGDGTFRAQIPEDWMQGRTAFGGLAAALGLRAVRETLRGSSAEARPLLSLDVAFVAPLGPGDIEITAQVLGQGRSVTQAAATLRFQGQVTVTAHAVMGEDRPSQIRVPSPPARPSGTVEDAVPFPFVPGITPEFTRHFEHRLTEGDIPFTGSEQAIIGGYVRHLTRASGEEAVVALADAWPAPVLPLASGPLPASTIRGSFHLASPLDSRRPASGDAAQTEGGELMWFRSECVRARGGYATTVGRLYQGDRLLAWCEQLVAVYG